MTSFRKLATFLIVTYGLVLLSGCNYDPDNVAPGSRTDSETMLAQATVPDVTNPVKIELSGNIALVGFDGDFEPVDPEDRDESGNVREFRVPCRALCAALLTTPEIESVTVNASDTSDGVANKGNRTFRTVPKSRCKGTSVMPLRPDELNLGQDHALSEPSPRSSGDFKSNEDRALLMRAGNRETAWRIRLATDNCIRADPAKTEFDFEIRNIYSSGMEGSGPRVDYCKSTDSEPVSVQRMEILDRSKTVLFRRSYASTKAVDVPLRKGFCGNVNWMVPGIGWKRSLIYTGKSFQLDSEVAQHTNLQTSIDQEQVRLGVREALRKSIANRNLSAGDPAFGLSETYLQLLSVGPITPADRIMLADMIRDERVVEFGGFYRVIRALGSDSGFLREPIVERIGRPGTNQGAANALSGELKSLPRFPFGDDERAILADPGSRSRALGLIAAGIDNDYLSSWQLLAILNEHADRMANSGNAGARGVPTSDYDVILTVRQGLCRRGVRAKELLPSLQGLQTRKVLASYIVETDEWQFMLARLGLPPEQLATPKGYGRDQYISLVKSRLDPRRMEQSEGSCR